jgi:hypothetical protein
MQDTEGATMPGLALEQPLRIAVQLGEQVAAATAAISLK